MISILPGYYSKDWIISYVLGMTAPRDGAGQCFGEEPGYCSHEEPEVSWHAFIEWVKYADFTSTLETACDVYWEVDLGV